MRKYIFLLSCLGLFLVGCSGNTGPAIKIGKVLDESQMKVSEETDVFNRNDNFAYSLSQTKPFDAKIITRRFYQGKVYVDMILKESVDMEIKPGTTAIGEAIPVSKIIYKYGSGDYMLLFTIDETVIAKKTFVIEGYAPRMTKTPEKPFNQEIMPARSQNDMPTLDTEDANNTAPADAQNTYTRPQTNIPLSPGDMMK